MVLTTVLSKEHIVTNTAVAHPALQRLEIHSTAPHNAKQQLYYQTYSTAAANELRTQECVAVQLSIGVMGICAVHLQSFASQGV